MTWATRKRAGADEASGARRTPASKIGSARKIGSEWSDAENSVGIRKCILPCVVCVTRELDGGTVWDCSLLLLDTGWVWHITYLGHNSVTARLTRSTLPVTRVTSCTYDSPSITTYSPSRYSAVLSVSRILYFT